MEMGIIYGLCLELNVLNMSECFVKLLHIYLDSKESIKG